METARDKKLLPRGGAAGVAKRVVKSSLQAPELRVLGREERVFLVVMEPAGGMR